MSHPGSRLSRPPTRRALWRYGAGALLAVGIGVGLTRLPARAEQSVQRLPAPALDATSGDGGSRIAVLSGGCFWGVQGVFEHVRGVTKVLSGYAGGSAATAQYETVSTGVTGHAESVRITFDPKQVSYGQLLQIFFSVAMDPTELNYQGPDQGTQYRSEVWVANADQQRVAEAYVAQLGQSHVFTTPIVTRVDKLAGFYPAEAYHQDYLERHPDQPYIRYNDIPKVENLKRLFPEIYTQAPVLARPVASAS